MEIKNGIINGHEYVDLGLSVKWATCNIGAEKPSDYGNYFEWIGTIVPIWTRRRGGKIYESIAGDPRYDFASSYWGGTWRMPIQEEVEELINKCKRVWTTQEGYNGYKFTGPNGNSIFLPAAGIRVETPIYSTGKFRVETSIYSTGKLCCYWSAPPNWHYSDSDGRLCFDGGLLFRGWDDCYKKPIRPITE